MFRKKKLKKIGRELIQKMDALTKQDFDVCQTEEETAVWVKKIVETGCKRKLDGSTEVCVSVPTHTLQYRNVDVKAHEWNKELGVGDCVYVSKQQYEEFCNTVAGFSFAETTSLTLRIQLTDSETLSLMDEWNKLAGTMWNVASLHTPPSYFFERFKLFNLIPDVQPFTDDEIDSLIGKIKESIVGEVKREITYH